MKKLLETMRWYGPGDSVTLSDIRQSGAKSVVTALHELPNGAMWPLKDILARKQLIEDTGLSWSVVESVPVHEDIKTRSGKYNEYIENYKKSIEHLSEAGIHIICYNFMPVLDWTRTDLLFEMDDGAKALRFEMKALAAFDLFVLNRPEAPNDYPSMIVQEAKDLFHSMDHRAVEKLQATILAGLPGAEEAYSLDDFRIALDRYRNIDHEQLAGNLSYFLNEIIPVAEKCDVLMAIHPDDPPFPILGLPRVVSTEADLDRVMREPDSPNNGITFCTGSLGVREDNDLVRMVNWFQDRIQFIHLRSTQRDSGGNFHESPHLEGDVPMFEVVKNLMSINKTRSRPIPMRPDHGHQILDDLEKPANPGYSAIGRLKGLAELRGLMYAIQWQE